MPYECVWYDAVPDGPWQPGWCVPIGYHLSNAYRRLQETAPRSPISVAVPDRNTNQRWLDMYGFARCTLFCVDAHPTDDPDGGWIVTLDGLLVNGDKAPLTVQPSLNAVGIYHGFITDGVLSDDIDA